MAKRLPAPPRSTAEQLKAFAREEYQNEAKFTQNLVRTSVWREKKDSLALGCLRLHSQASPARAVQQALCGAQALLKAVSMFVGAILLFRNAGEAFNV